MVGTRVRVQATAAALLLGLSACGGSGASLDAAGGVAVPDPGATADEALATAESLHDDFVRLAEQLAREAPDAYAGGGLPDGDGDSAVVRFVGDVPAPAAELLAGFDHDLAVDTTATHTLAELEALRVDAEAALADAVGGPVLAVVDQRGGVVDLEVGDVDVDAARAALDGLDGPLVLRVAGDVVPTRDR